MVIDELEESSHHRISQILRVLESMYGLTIDFGAAESYSELQSIYETFGEMRATIIRESQFNSYNSNPEYTKACLIQEAIRIFLSEVAPKRLKRKKNSA